MRNSECAIAGNASGNGKGSAASRAAIMRTAQFMMQSIHCKANSYRRQFITMRNSQSRRNYGVTESDVLPLANAEGHIPHPLNQKVSEHILFAM